MKADVAIVGAGTAGSAAALACAERGLDVICIDRRPLDQAGARWVNGVAGWMFDEAEIARPQGDELVGEGHDFYLVAGHGPEKLRLRDHGVLEVDMRGLVARLQREAREKGARFIGEAQLKGFNGHELTTAAGKIRARYYVDASGLGGARLLDQPRIDRRDICAAAQQVHEIRDMDAARAWFASFGIAPGHTLCFTGIEGGYSIINARIEGETIGILTGSIPNGVRASGKEMLDTFVAEHSFIGEKLYGGARAIPLRRPYERLGRGNIALLGDAACQVFSAHGSGIGIGLIAARMLADALANGAGPHGYTVAFHRRYGGLFATYELFRRFSQKLTSADIAEMMRAGLMDTTTVGAGLSQRLPRLSFEVARSKLLASSRAPGLTFRLSKVLARGAVASLLYARCPENETDFERWAARVRDVMSG